MKNCRTHFSVALVTPRLVFFDPGEKPKDESADKAKEGPTKSTEQLMAEAKVALEDAKSERSNIEDHYGKPDKEGKLPSGTPKAIQEQYVQLGETIKTLEAAQKKPKAVVEATLTQLDTIFANLHTASEDEKRKGIPLDPMAGLEYKPKARSAKPDVEAEKAAKADAAKKAEADKQAAKPKKVDAKQEALEKDLAVVEGILQKVQINESEITAEEKATLKRILVPGQLWTGEGKGGQQYDMELTNDKKWVRINVEFPPSGNIKYEALHRVYKMDDNAKGTPEFKFKTKEEVETKKLAENTKELETNLAWLESEGAPLGSTVLVKTENVKRKNPETGEEEDITLATGVRKGTDGLRIVYLETDPHATGDTKIKEVKSVPYKKDTVMALVSADSSIMSVEGSPVEKKGELKRGLNNLSHNLMGYYIINGTSDKNFQRVLSDMKKLIVEYNIGKFSHKDTTVGYLVKVEDGKISILDPGQKNPAYKSAEETPDVPKYAVKYGPTEVSAIA